MNAKGLMSLLLLAAAAVSADESPAIDVFAGWSWDPFAYGYPYPYFRPTLEGWVDGAGGPYPTVGLSRTWPYSDSYWPYRYGVGPYPYNWGLGYGARVRVYPGSPLRLDRKSTRLNSSH